MGKRPEPPAEEPTHKGRFGLGLAFHQADETGRLIVAKVFPGTPAEAGGMQPEDMLLALDGNKIKDCGQLKAELRKKNAGDKVVLNVEREGQTIDKSLVLKTVPGR